VYDYASMKKIMLSGGEHGGNEIEFKEDQKYYTIEKSGVFWTYRVDDLINPKTAIHCHSGNLQQKDDYLAQQQKDSSLIKQGAEDESSGPWTFAKLRDKKVEAIQAQFDLEIRKYPTFPGKLPLDLYLNELQRRDSEKIAKSMQKSTDVMVRLTWAVTVLTIVTTIATIIGLLNNKS
jgi:hypothetical protein